MVIEMAKLTELEGYGMYEDILDDIDGELKNINTILDNYYSVLTTNTSGGKLVYGAMKLSVLKRAYLVSKIGIVCMLTPKKTEETGLQLSQAVLDQIMATKK